MMVVIAGFIKSRFLGFPSWHSRPWMVSTQPTPISHSFTSNFLGRENRAITKSFVNNDVFVFDVDLLIRFFATRRWRLKPQLGWSKDALQRLASSHQKEST